jgi:arginase family enzyme
LTDLRDTWKPKVFGGSPSQVAAINHGTYFYHAAMEGLLKNDTNIHAGIRTTLSGPSDYENDGYCGFEIVEAREIDTIGRASTKCLARPSNMLTYSRNRRNHQEDQRSSRHREPRLPFH